MLPEAHLWTRGMIEAMKDSEALSLPKLQESRCEVVASTTRQRQFRLSPLISIALLYVYALRHGKVKV